MVSLDFTNATTKEQVEEVFNKTKKALEKEIKDLGKIREIFFEDKTKPEDNLLD